MRSAKPSAHFAFLFILILLLLSAPYARRVAAAASAYDCEGNACSVITLTWEEEGQQFRAENSSNQWVKIEVTTFAGKSSVRVEAHKSAFLQVKTFNGPYHADFE